MSRSSTGESSRTVTHAMSWRGIELQSEREQKLEDSTSMQLVVLKVEVTKKKEWRVIIWELTEGGA